MTDTTAEIEGARLATLHRYNILDTPHEAEFGAIVQIVRVTVAAPIVLVSLIDKHRQWFKARLGLGLTETPRSMSFCEHALPSDQMLIVPDAREDERFVNNPLVTGKPGIRFYAGAPLTAPNGIRIGTLCAIDTCPRPGLSNSQSSALKLLATETIALMDRRIAKAQAEAVLA